MKMGHNVCFLLMLILHEETYSVVGGRQEYKRIEELTTCCWIETQKEDKCREGKTTLSENRETAFITFSTIREFTLVTRAPN